MSENKNKTPEKATAYRAIGVAIGLVFGGILGLITGNIPVFTGGGMILGLAIGQALDNSKRE